MNVSVGERAGKPAFYIPLYMTPFVIEGFVSEHADSESEAKRVAKTERMLMVNSPDLSAWN